jgi:hypothetical protein
MSSLKEVGMVAFIFICCFLNLIAGVYLVITSRALSQELSGAICLLMSSLFFIGGALIYKVDKLITEIKKK